MIRPLREEDYSAAVAIVNDGWRTVYGEYVNPALLSDTGCRERAAELERDFRSRRLEEQVADSLIYSDVYGSDHCPVGLLLK